MLAQAAIEEAMSVVDRGGSSSANNRSSDGDMKAAVALITSEECQGHLSSVGESYLAALSRVKSYEKTIVEQQNQIKSLELKLQSSQGQNFKLVQEVIKLSSSGGQGPVGGAISDNNRHSLLEEGDTTTAVTSNVTMPEAKEEPSSASSSTLAVSPQDPIAAQKETTDITKDQLQDQLCQLQSEMATVSYTVQQ